jgi:hypothetical protein
MPASAEITSAPAVGLPSASVTVPRTFTFNGASTMSVIAGSAPLVSLPPETY